MVCLLDYTEKVQYTGNTRGWLTYIVGIGLTLFISKLLHNNSTLDNNENLNKSML
jgi:hypothetical protein